MSGEQRPTFTYLGHSTVLCTLPGGERVLIDPWVDQNPACPDDHKELEHLDAILVTHAHFDHMGDGVAIAKKHHPQVVVGSFEVCAWLEQHGVENTSGMNLGGSQEVLGMKVTMVRADHSSGLVEHGTVVYGGPAAGYVVRLPNNYTFYHSGDTALFSDMQLIGELYRPTLAFLPIGDLFTMDPHQAARACRFLGVQKVIPIHWGTFPALTGRPSQLERELADQGVNCEAVVLEPGESY